MDNNSIKAESDNRKYFYDDPLAAAWMAKHFGMKLIMPWGEPIVWTDLFKRWSECILANPNLPTERVYIHPDSLPLLEPQVGDVMRTPWGNPWLFGSACVGDFSGSIIIFRKGTVFHHPKQA